jgi:hypothetical protein
MYTPYIRVSSGSFLTTLDPGTANPRNTVGCLYSPPPISTAIATGTSATKGYSAQPVYKYVLYLSTTNPAPVAAPAPVYYTDESFSTVSGNAAEAFFTTAGACIAGYLGPNTTSISGLTAAQLNNSFAFIQVAGLLVGAYAPTTTTAAGVPNPIGGLTTGNWTSVVNTTLAAGSRLLGLQWTAIASSACDVLVSGYQAFWGS